MEEIGSDLLDLLSVEYALPSESAFADVNNAYHNCGFSWPL
jgi:hypothetical protein